jgi:hypothetical protein
VRPSQVLLDDEVAFLPGIVPTSSTCVSIDRFCEREADADNPLLIQPMIVLSADKEAIAKIYRQAMEHDVRLSLYIHDMFSTGHDAANRAAMKQYPCKGDHRRRQGLTAKPSPFRCRPTPPIQGYRQYLGIVEHLVFVIEDLPLLLFKRNPRQCQSSAIAVRAIAWTSNDSSTDNRPLTVEIGIPNERAARLMLSNRATLTNVRTSSRFATGGHSAIFGNWFPEFPI